MKKLLCLLSLAALAAATPVRSEVLIYKGHASLATTPGTLASKLELYMIADIPSQKVGFVLFYKTNGVKTQQPGPPTDLDMTTAPIQGGGTARIIAKSFTPSPAPSFSHHMIFFRGAQKDLIVATSPAKTTRNEPRIFIGSQLVASENAAGNGSFIDLRIKVLFQEPLTIKANNEAKTLQQTLDDLSAALAAKGYEVP